jgi:hypothetical protein
MPASSCFRRERRESLVGGRFQTGVRDKRWFGNEAVGFDDSMTPVEGVGQNMQCIAASVADTCKLRKRAASVGLGDVIPVTSGSTMHAKMSAKKDMNRSPNQVSILLNSELTRREASHGYPTPLIGARS